MGQHQSQPESPKSMAAEKKPQPSPHPRPLRPPHLTHGRVLNRPFVDIRSSFTFLRELGRGQFGVTYLVSDKSTNSLFACKLIPSRRLLSRPAMDDVRREIQIMYHLTGHRNIVELKGVYEDRTGVYLVMELCEGGELFERIVKRGFYTEKKAAEICREIVMVVHNCHSLGVMHRDLKPENFLFLTKEEDSPLKATDFGLSTFFKPGMSWFDLGVNFSEDQIIFVRLNASINNLVLKSMPLHHRLNSG